MLYQGNLAAPHSTRSERRLKGTEIKSEK
jgi:hypothetical protein